MMDREEYDKYEEEVKDIEDFIGTDIKINPSYYIHNAIVKAQEALKDNDVQAGIFKFRFFAENIEILSKAAEMLPEDYDEKIRQFKQSDEYNKEEDLVKHFKLANYKMQLLLSQVFASKMSTTPLKA